MEAPHKRTRSIVDLFIHHVGKILFRKNRRFAREIIIVSNYSEAWKLDLEKIGPVALDLITHVTINTVPEERAISRHDLLVYVAFRCEEQRQENERKYISGLHP